MKYAPKKSGRIYIPASGKVFDHHEVDNAIAAARQGWWTEGVFSKKFEKKFSRFTGAQFVTLTNSGSSANLLAITALTAEQLGEKRLKKGDEIITSAVAFPTTVNPIIQNGLIPVFIDSDLGTRNPRWQDINRAITKKTRGIILAHTLGNPLPLNEIMHLVQKYHLWFIEDCCDALGSTYHGNPVGSFGHIATYSFYPAHHITMGEGGAVTTNNPLIHRLVRQFRDWGRDCWCDTGTDNSCHNRFGWKLGDLPKGYDHKYIYSQIGYNLKLTDFQAAIGLAQMSKLKRFIRKRKQNFQYLYTFCTSYKQFFILPEWDKLTEPSWFGFMLVVRNNAPFTKLELVQYLENHAIGTRSLFSGNLLRHPAYLRHKGLKLSGSLSNADMIMHNGFWIGVWPGISATMIRYMTDAIAAFIQKYE